MSILVTERFLVMKEELLKIFDTKNENPSRYSLEPPNLALAALTLDKLARRLGGNTYRCFSDIPILDLGCGCDPQYGDHCLPLLPMIAGAFAARAYGIDMFPYTRGGAGLYTHITADLVKPVDLTLLTGERQFMLINATGLVGSNSSPALTIHADYQGEDYELKQQLIAEARLALDPNGIIIWDVYEEYTK